MYVDLHCHSYYSDGAQTPEYLVSAALERGLTHLALTDHDCLCGVEHLWQATPRDTVPAVKEGWRQLKLIAGVELSCDWNGLEIHVVGLLKELRTPTLDALLSEQQNNRRQRAEAIAVKLDAVGATGARDYLAALPATALTRSHIADFLVASGICKNKQKAFKSYLGRRGKAYVAAIWASLDQAVSAIQAAGGIAILAHPSRYPLTRSKLSRLISDFRAAGGEAMEVSYANLDPTAKKRLLELANEHALYYSCGSDFHTLESGWTALGKYPRLEPSATKNAIWEHPRWHSIVSSGRTVFAPPIEESEF
jgi:predicted metal-dependent phosphoesterase TrpH